MNIPVWLFILLLATNFFVCLFMFIVVYLIAGLHDLYCVKYKKEQKKQEKEAPYFIEKDLPKDDDNV